jgi:hypothetical protein
LTKVLKLDTKLLSFHIHAFLGTDQSWAKPLNVGDFSLEGTLNIPLSNDPEPTKIGVALFEGIGLTSLEVQLKGIANVQGTTYEYGVSGELTMTVSGSTTPLYFKYNIQEKQNGDDVVLHASLDGDSWQNALGTGLTV